MAPIIQRFQSADGTRRYLIALEDGRTVESVLMPDAKRDAICISSQVGCAVECRFCLTAQMGLERNLTAQEISGQVLAIAEDIGLATNKRRLNVVMMGMGEPLLNLPNVLEAIRILCEPRGLNLAPRRITISTSGITPKLSELAQANLRPRLAVSLNASSHEQRCELMPITRKYHLAGLLAACHEYVKATRDEILFEYVLLAGVNDSDADAHRVVELLKPLGTAKLNLIPLNPAPGIPFQPPTDERAGAFHAIVEASLPCYTRKSRGRDVYAACGQLKRMPGEELAQIAAR